MNKQDLVKKIAEEVGISQKQAMAALECLTESIMAEVATGGKIQLVGFGTFESKVRAARAGLNPQTKEAIQIPECKVPSFKAGKVFKDAVKG